MTLIAKRYPKLNLKVEVIAYHSKVPFFRLFTVCEHTLITNDELAPLVWAGVSADANPVPGFGALYRLIGDGTHAPTFNSAFKQKDGSGTYDSTLNAVNLIKFWYDGVDYWYEILHQA
jgi:hypothetical protein